MKKYIGTKTVQATPAVRKGDKIYLPGDEIPKSLETVEDGYKVIYPNGYESWCPKDEFEKTYHLAETLLKGCTLNTQNSQKRMEISMLSFGAKNSKNVIPTQRLSCWRRMSQWQTI